MREWERQEIISSLIQQPAKLVLNGSRELDPARQLNLELGQVKEIIGPYKTYFDQICQKKQWLCESYESLSNAATGESCSTGTAAISNEEILQAWHNMTEKMLIMKNGKIRNFAAQVVKTSLDSNSIHLAPKNSEDKKNIKMS